MTAMRNLWSRIVRAFRIAKVFLKSMLSIPILLIVLKARELRRRVRDSKRKRGSNVNEKFPDASKATSQDGQLPPFPMSEDELTAGKTSTAGDGPGTEKSDEGVAIELCADVIKLPFELWHVAVPPVEPLADSYAMQLAKPFSRIVDKHGLGKYLKDEVILLIGLGTAVIPRIQQTKAYHATYHSGKTRSGQDIPHQGAGPEGSV